MDKYEESIRRATALKLGNKTFPANEHHRQNQINLVQSSSTAANVAKARSASCITVQNWSGNNGNANQVCKLLN